METYRFDSQNQQQKRRGRAAADCRATGRVLGRNGSLEFLVGLKKGTSPSTPLFHKVAAVAASKAIGAPLLMAFEVRQTGMFPPAARLTAGVSGVFGTDVGDAESGTLPIQRVVDQPAQLALAGNFNN